MKYCIDCRWFEPATNTWCTPENKLEYGVCANPKNIIPNGLSPDLIDYQIKFAQIHRQNEPYFIRDWRFRRKRIGKELCGRAGDWWEPKDA